MTGIGLKMWVMKSGCPSLSWLHVQWKKKMHSQGLQAELQIKYCILNLHLITLTKSEDRQCPLCGKVLLRNNNKFPPCDAMNEWINFRLLQWSCIRFIFDSLWLSFLSCPKRLLIVALLIVCSKGASQVKLATHFFYTPKAYNVFNFKWFMCFDASLWSSACETVLRTILWSYALEQWFCNSSALPLKILCH